MHLVNDQSLSVRLVGQRERTVLGEHYTLSPTEDMPIETFEQLYHQLIQTFQKCSGGVVHGGGEDASGTSEGAGLASLINPHVVPVDKPSRLAALALQSFAEQTPNRNAVSGFRAGQKISNLLKSCPTFPRRCSQRCLRWTCARATQTLRR
jgi:hypothetical protein